jgi:hypothetical protein
MKALADTRNTALFGTMPFLRAVRGDARELNMHNHGRNVNVIIAGIHNLITTGASL